MHADSRRHAAGFALGRRAAAALLVAVLRAAAGSP
jgi:hypothetical protein